MMAITNTPPLLSTAALQDGLVAHDLFVLDTRLAEAGGRAAYEAGHIPGAIYGDYAADGWRVTVGAAPGMLPGAEALSALLGRLGVRPHDHVVVAPGGTSSGDFASAARIYWTFRIAGHPRLSLLDGGVAAWMEEGRAVEVGPSPQRVAGPYPVRLEGWRRATLPQVARIVAEGGAALLDARGLKSFAGEEQSRQAARPGRLPGALMVEGATAYDPGSHRLKSRPELDRLFAPVPDGEVVSYCNTGQSAATDWFVLSEIMGRPGVSLYDGSMSEWSQDPARPMATGPVNDSLSIRD